MVAPKKREIKGAGALGPRPELRGQSQYAHFGFEGGRSELAGYDLGF